MELPCEIYTVESVRKIDKAAIEDAEISGYALMTRAAEATMQEIKARYPDAKRWQVVCGSGNNAGDGYVLARLAGQQGVAVSVLAMSDPESLAGDASSAWMDFAAEGGVVAFWDGSLDEEAELIVDALLGNGLQRDLAGDYEAVVHAINEHPAAVCAVDIPTGLHGDTGVILGAAVRADMTVTFVGLKSGLFIGNGPRCCGELCYSDLDIPAECLAQVAPDLRLIDSATIAAALPRRDPLAHKGDFGHVLLIGGGPGMSGAIRLCGEGALLAGAGKVSIATHPDHAGQIAAGRPELMCHGVENAEQLKPLIERADTIAIGPGLGTDDWAKLMCDLGTAVKIPVVVDADALNLMVGSKIRKGNWILTPHPGEMSRLINRPVQDVQKDRRQAASDLRNAHGGVVVLKGAGTLIVTRSGAPWLCAAGNPGMASPGMGDVLTGVIAGLLGQGLSTEMAAVVGVAVHAQAGDRAAQGGERGLTARDVLAELRACVNP